MSNKSQTNQEPEKLVRTVFMGRERIGNTLYFESDEDFGHFAFHVRGKYFGDEGRKMILFAYGKTDECKQCVRQGIRFEIKDEHSEVAERQQVTMRVPVRDKDGNVVTERENSIDLEDKYDIKVNKFDRSRYESLLKSAIEKK